MITTIHYKYGFEFNNVKYVWKNKKLFRLPYSKKKRSYSFKEIPIYCFKATLVANIQRQKLTINKLKYLTVKIDWTYKFINDLVCPF